MQTFQDRLNLIVNEITNGNLREFSRRLNFSHPTLYNYVNGRSPSTDVLIKIRETFDISIDWILTGEGKKYISEPFEVREKPVDYIHKKDIDQIKLVGCLRMVEDYLLSVEKNTLTGKESKGRRYVILYLTSNDFENITTNANLIMSLIF